MCSKLWSPVLLALIFILIRPCHGLSVHQEIQYTFEIRRLAIEHFEYQDGEAQQNEEETEVLDDPDLVHRVLTGHLRADEVRAAHERLFLDLQAKKNQSVVCPELNNFTFTNDPPFDVLGVPECGKTVKPKLVLYMKPKPKALLTTLLEKIFLWHSNVIGNTTDLDECELMPYDLPNNQTDFCFHQLNERTDITKVVFLTHGFLNTFETDWLHQMRDDILTMEPTTAFVIMGWGRGMADILNYWRSARNARYAAQVMYMTVASLQRAVKRDVFVHCIGHSLGAHVCGLAGKILSGDKAARKFNRISGMDPAGPMFCNDVPYPFNYMNISSEARLDASDAALVDVIHTDGGARSYGFIPQYGTLQTLGTVDFYPGSSKYYGQYQPGCENIYDVVSCSHSRSHQLYAASIKDAHCQASRKCEGDPHQIPTDCTLINETLVGEQLKPCLGYWLSEGDPPVGLYTVDVGANAPYCVNRYTA